MEGLIEMDFDTYVSTERVRAAQVRKPEEIVTSAGRFVAPRYSYIVERTLINEIGQEYVTTVIMDKDEFNEKYKRLDWREEDRQALRKEGYDDGYDDGWNACASAKDTANNVVREGAQPAELPPVGDRLETDGPVSSRDESDAVISEHGNHDGDSEGAGPASGGPSDDGEGEVSGSDSGSDRT